MHRSVAVVLTVGLAGFCAAQAPRPASRGLLEGVHAGRTRVLDLSYALSDRLTPWPGDFDVFEARARATVEKEGYFTRSFCTIEHFGTHMDAPAHFPPGKLTVDQIPTRQLFGPAVVVDVVQDAAANPDYRLTTARLRQWEEKHGLIPAGAIVVLRTGWATRFRDPARYYNTDAAGIHHWPGFSVEAARFLLERKVSGLGIDTLSVDFGPSRNFEVHRITHGAGLYHLENLADLSELPEAGVYLVVAPIKLEGGSGGPVRVFALLP